MPVTGAVDGGRDGGRRAGSEIVGFQAVPDDGSNADDHGNRNGQRKMLAGHPIGPSSMRTLKSAARISAETPSTMARAPIGMRIIAARLPPYS